MFKDHARIINAIASVGEISGRKKLQKMIYIAKNISFPFEEKFHFHFYGPYSEELTLKIEELCEMGYLKEEKEKQKGYVQYCYSLSEAGQDFLRLFPVDMPCLKECLIDMNEHNARFLELVSTILYFQSQPKEEVIEKIQTLKDKQNYSEDEISEAYTYIERLTSMAKLH